MKLVGEMVRSMRDTWDAEHVGDDDVSIHITIAACLDGYDDEVAWTKELALNWDANDRAVAPWPNEYLCALAQEEIEKANRKATS